MAHQAAVRLRLGLYLESSEEKAGRRQGDSDALPARLSDGNPQSHARRAIERQEGVEVLVDRRSPERRQSRYPVNGEQLRADQRRLKEEILEVVISD